MPRGPKIPPVIRKQWLESHEHGERIDVIANREGRAERTVNDQIRQAQRERRQEQVLAGLLQDAYQRHFEDLLGIAKKLQDGAQKPGREGLLSRTDRRSQMLHSALRSHIPRSRLWRACRAWEDHTQSLNRVRLQVKEQVARVVDSTLPPKIQDHRDAWIESLYFAIEETAKDQSLDHMGYEMEPKDGTHALKWGAYGNLGPAGDMSSNERLREMHLRLREKVTTAPYVDELVEVLRTWTKAREVIEEEVEALLLRRLLPGRCRLCPD